MPQDRTHDLLGAKTAPFAMCVARAAGNGRPVAAFGVGITAIRDICIATARQAISAAGKFSRPRRDCGPERVRQNGGRPVAAFRPMDIPCLARMAGLATPIPHLCDADRVAPRPLGRSANDAGMLVRTVGQSDPDARAVRTFTGPGHLGTPPNNVACPRKGPVRISGRPGDRGTAGLGRRFLRPSSHRGGTARAPRNDSTRNAVRLHDPLMTFHWFHSGGDACGIGDLIAREPGFPIPDRNRVSGIVRNDHGTMPDRNRQTRAFLVHRMPGKPGFS